MAEAKKFSSKLFFFVIFDSKGETFKHQAPPF